MDVVLDTSTLINFARINRLDLLVSHPSYRFVITDHVRGEISEHYADQLAIVTQAVDSGGLTEITVTSTDEVNDFANLIALKTLGSGECSAIAVAKHRSLKLAIDDIRARKQAVAFHKHLTFLDTADLIVSLIQATILSIEEADAIKKDWEANHRFRLPFPSFSDRISE